MYHVPVRRHKFREEIIRGAAPKKKVAKKEAMPTQWVENTMYSSIWLESKINTVCKFY
jgi:hypothetical protein